LLLCVKKLLRLNQCPKTAVFVPGVASEQTGPCRFRSRYMPRDAGVFGSQAWDSNPGVAGRQEGLGK